ncbi:hypothetical protein XA68_16391 [Ophiocordyceps unilateralis]|uniref:Uncharacterized protein n=1 Tax=Ophiocordyceps unilateralis TaxID=268505 RepID=A0A2A9P6B6_OPHUN|nr:hypothetical protein XA68_16391 [Ophiocordyceps unilateralis]
MASADDIDEAGSLYDEKGKPTVCSERGVGNPMNEPALAQHDSKKPDVASSSNSTTVNERDEARHGVEPADHVPSAENDVLKVAIAEIRADIIQVSGDVDALNENITECERSVKLDLEKLGTKLDETEVDQLRELIVAKFAALRINVIERLRRAFGKFLDRVA